MRLQYPPDIKIILMPCTGRVDIIHLLKAFEAGADAVFVAGCLEGECHYLVGNIRAKKRVNKLKKDFAQMGLEPERVEMFNLSSSEGPKFAAIAKEMVERVLKLGPSPVRRPKPGPPGLPPNPRPRPGEKLGEVMGEGQRARALSPPPYPHPNPISRGDPPGRPKIMWGALRPK